MSKPFPRTQHYKSTQAGANLFKASYRKVRQVYCPTSDIGGNDVCRRLPAARGASSGVRESDKCIQVPETQTVRSGAPVQL